jgi:hypothetical protein
MSENNVVINNNNTVNVPQPSRGAGTALMIIFLWPVLLFWWQLLAAVWLVWLLVAAIVTIFEHDFFSRTWYYPWPAWMFGIR